MKRINKGFTLAELLIVVAIIAVLVTIAIPLMTSELNKARNAADAADVRAAYAEATVSIMNGKPLRDNLEIGVSEITVNSSGGNHENNGWENGTIKIGEVVISAPGADAKHLKLTQNEDGSLTASWVA